MRSPDTAYGWILVALLVLGAALRFALCWANPSWNSFRQSLPALLILRNGEIPGKLDCWYCGHAPVLYVISAGVVKVALAAGAPARRGVRAAARRQRHAAPILAGARTSNPILTRCARPGAAGDLDAATPRLAGPPAVRLHPARIETRTVAPPPRVR